MKAIVPPNNRRGGAVRALPPVVPPMPRPTVQTARRDQFGALVLRQVGGAR